MEQRTTREFSRAQIWEIANFYAASSYWHSAEFFANEYNITTANFYRILHRAVEECIVDDGTVYKIAKKSAYNSEVKAGEYARKRSEKNYKQLIKKRQEYMLPKDEAIRLINKYANSDDGKRTFLLKVYMTPSLFDRTIKEGIIKSWVSDEVVTKLKEKSLNKHNDKATLEFWEKLLKLRNENKKGQG